MIESLFWAYALHITVLLDLTIQVLSNDNAGKKNKIYEKLITNSSNSFLFRESYTSIQKSPQIIHRTHGDSSQSPYPYHTHTHGNPHGNPHTHGSPERTTWRTGYQIVKWQITSRDPRRCCEEVRSAILATAWLLVLFVAVYHLFYICDWQWLVQWTRDGTGSATLTRDPTRDASDPLSWLTRTDPGSCICITMYIGWSNFVLLTLFR